MENFPGNQQPTFRPRTGAGKPVRPKPGITLEFGYRLVIHRLPQGRWRTTCPAFPGFSAEAASQAGARDAAKAAICRYVRDLHKRQAPLPPSDALEPYAHGERITIHLPAG